MKKLLFVILVVVVAILATDAVAGHYKEYQNKKAHEAQAVVQKEQDEVAEVQAANDVKYGLLEAKYKDLVAECRKGQNAFDKLTPYTKTQTEAPNCPGEVL